MRLPLRLKSLGLSLLGLTVLTYIVPPMYWYGIGVWNDEPFYQGKPASYWSEELSQWRFTGVRKPSDALEQMLRIPAWRPGFCRQLPQALQTVFIYETLDWFAPYQWGQPPLVDDPFAIPILAELALQDKHFSVRVIAAMALSRMRDQSIGALTPLSKLDDANREDSTIKAIACHALGR